MSRTIRVLFCLEDLCYGGTQRQTLELAQRLNRSIFSPSMLMLTGPTDLDDIARDAGISLYYLGRGRKVAPFFFLSLGVALRRLAPDCIIPCTALPNIWVRIWGRILDIPVIGTCRGGGGPKRQHERFLWRLTSHMICNTKTLQSVLQNLGVAPSHITYIPNGVDTSFFAPSSPPPSSRPPLFLCVARLAKDKDHIALFKAFALVVQKCPQARLLCVGDGPEEANLKAWVEDHKNLPITFQAGTTDVRPYYSMARCVVLSSVREGQPNVLLEAMSAGLPVCATAVGGIPMLVQDGVTGLLAEPGNIENLAAQMLRLADDPEFCDRLGRAGRAWVTENCSFTRMVEAHTKIITSVVEKKINI